MRLGASGAGGKKRTQCPFAEAAVDEYSHTSSIHVYFVVYVMAVGDFRS